MLLKPNSQPDPHSSGSRFLRSVHLETDLRNPDSLPVWYLLQALAEFAARAPQPFLVVGVLHRDFAAYADRLSARDRKPESTRSSRRTA